MPSHNIDFHKYTRYSTYPSVPKDYACNFSLLDKIVIVIDIFTVVIAYSPSNL